MNTMSRGLGNENVEILDSNQSKMETVLKRNGVVALEPSIDIPASVRDHCALAETIVAETACMDVMLKQLEEAMHNVHRELEAPDKKDEKQEVDNDSSGDDSDDDEKPQKRGKKKKKKLRGKVRKKKKGRTKDTDDESSEDATKKKKGKKGKLKKGTKLKKNKMVSDDESSVAPTDGEGCDDASISKKKLKRKKSKPTAEDEGEEVPVGSKEITKQSAETTKEEKATTAAPSLFMMAPPVEEQASSTIPKKKLFAKSKFGSFSDDSDDDSKSDDDAPRRRRKSKRGKKDRKRKKKKRRGSDSGSEGNDDPEPLANSVDGNSRMDGYSSVTDQSNNEQPVMEEIVAEHSMIVQPAHDKAVNNTDDDTNPDNPLAQQPTRPVPEEPMMVDEPLILADAMRSDEPNVPTDAGELHSAHGSDELSFDFDAVTRNQRQLKEEALELSKTSGLEKIMNDTRLTKKKKRRLPKRCQTMPLPPRPGEERFDWANFRKTQDGAAYNSIDLNSSERNKQHHDGARSLSTMEAPRAALDDLLMGDESEKNVMVDDSERSDDGYEADNSMMNRSYSEVFGKHTRSTSPDAGHHSDELSFSFSAFREHTLSRKEPRGSRPSHLQRLVAKKKHISANDDLFTLDMGSESDEDSDEEGGLLSSLPNKRRSLHRSFTAPSSTG